MSVPSLKRDGRRSQIAQIMGLPPKTLPVLARQRMRTQGDETALRATTGADQARLDETMPVLEAFQRYLD